MTYVDSHDVHGGRLRIARSRGASSGILLIVLGAWGALIPLVGPYFDFGFTPDDTWNLTNGRWWLEVLPGIVTVVGGLLLLLGTDRILTSLGGWLAAASGAWFVIGTTLQPVVNIDAVGSPIHTSLDGSTVERLTMFGGLGVLIVLIAALALGALGVVGVRDVRHAQDRAARRQQLRDEARIDTELRRRGALAPADDADANDTVALPPTHAHASAGAADDTTRLDRTDV